MYLLGFRNIGIIFISLPTKLWVNEYFMLWNCEVIWWKVKSQSIHTIQWSILLAQYEVNIAPQLLRCWKWRDVSMELHRLWLLQLPVGASVQGHAHHPRGVPKHECRRSEPCATGGRIRLHQCCGRRLGTVSGILHYWHTALRVQTNLHRDKQKWGVELGKIIPSIHTWVLGYFITWLLWPTHP